MNGGDNTDTITGSNGDSEVIDGGLGTDVVQVNGSPSAGDTFTVGANGTRVAFSRTNLVPFSLDIGTTEALIPVGAGGGDSMAVNSLAGVSDLTALNLFGLEGDDTFNVVPSSTVSFIVNGGSPILPTLPGDALSVDVTGTTGLVLVRELQVPVVSRSQIEHRYLM